VIRRAFIKRFSAGVLGCGMLADALLSKGPTMDVVETILTQPVATTPARKAWHLGPRVQQRDDMSYSFEQPYPDSHVRELRRYRLGVLHVHKRD